MTDRTLARCRSNVARPRSWEGNELYAIGAPEPRRRRNGLRTFRNVLVVCAAAFAVGVISWPLLAQDGATVRPGAVPADATPAPTGSPETDAGAAAAGEAATADGAATGNAPAARGLPVPDLTPLPDAAAAPAGTEVSSGPVVSTWDFVRMVLVLGAVVVAIYLVFLLIKRATGGRVNENELITLLGSRSLGGSRNLHLVQVGTSFYLVGAADAAVSLVAEITDPESLDTIKLDVSTTTVAGRRTFADVLGDLFASSSTRSLAGATAGDAQQAPAASYLGRQRERLRNLGAGSQAERGPQPPAPEGEGAR